MWTQLEQDTNLKVKIEKPQVFWKENFNFHLKMREYFLFSKPTAFFKAHKPIEVFFNEPIGGGEKPLHGKVIGPRGRVHDEASFWNLFWWLNTDDDKIEASSLMAARRKYHKLRAQDPPIALEEINDDTTQESLEEIESWPPNKFGRGQAASSVLCSSVSTGWRPKPIQWRLVGGAGGKPRKKMEPKINKWSKIRK